MRSREESCSLGVPSESSFPPQDVFPPTVGLHSLGEPFPEAGEGGAGGRWEHWPDAGSLGAPGSEARRGHADGQIDPSPACVLQDGAR